MKKIICSILILLLLVGVLSTTVFATQNDVNDNEITTVYLVNEQKSSSSKDADWFVPDAFSLILTLIVVIVTCVILVASHNKANKQISATNYIAENGYSVNDRKERYVKTYDTVQKNYYGNNK